MKVNRNTLLWAIKKSSSLSEVTQRLGREPEYEEQLLKKMLRFYPEAEDYLKRKASIKEMKEHKVNEDWDALKESRLEYIGATNRLITNKLIGKREIDILVYKLEKKRNAIPASKEIEDKATFEFLPSISIESREDTDTFQIDSPIVKQLMATVGRK
jgi:hypothetical protein